MLPDRHANRRPSGATAGLPKVLSSSLCSDPSGFTSHNHWRSFDAGPLTNQPSLVCSAFAQPDAPAMSVRSTIRPSGSRSFRLSMIAANPAGIDWPAVAVGPGVGPGVELGPA